MRKLVFTQKGVGLVEAVVAIGILITGIISVVSLSQSNIASSQGVAARLTAINLAREGVEGVRSMRDGNWLKGRTNVTGEDNAWDSGFNGAGDVTAIAVLNADSLAWTLDFAPASMTDNGTRLRRNQDRGLYRQSRENPIPAGELASLYSRLLTIYSICRNRPGQQETYDNLTCSSGWDKVGIRVISRVEWQERGQAVGLEVEDWLYNWRYSFTPYVP